MAEENTTGDANLAREVDKQLGNLSPATNLPKNPKRVVRTYASDLAMLSGKPAPAQPKPVQPVAPARPAAPPAPPPITSEPKPIPTLSEAVAGIKLPGSEATIPSAQPTPIQKRPEPMLVRKPAPSPPPPIPLQKQAPEPAKPQEARIVSESIVHREARPSFFARLFASIFGNREEVPAHTPWTPPVPKPAMQSAPASVPPAPQPAPPAPTFSAPPAAPPAQAADEDREAILARLRGRVSAYQAANPTPAPVFPAPKPEFAQKPPPRPLPQPIVSTSATPEAPERLQTYAGDFASRIQTQNASAFSVLAAEQDAKRGSGEAPRSSRGLLYVLGTAVFVIGGSLVLYFAYGYLQSNAPVPVANSGLPASLISPDDTATVSGTGYALMSAIAGQANAALTVGNVRTLYLSVSSTSPGGAATTLTRPGGALIVALQLPAPDILLRNINDDSTVGIVHAGNETRTFFILDADSYERVFAGMLSWEPTIANDLSLLYPAYADTAPETATSTATSTIPAAIAQPGFVDETVSSHDVRALKDAQGRTVLLYGFRDQNTLIIARDETAFTVLLARLSATGSQ